MWRSLVAWATAVLGEGSNWSELKSHVVGAGCGGGTSGLFLGETGRDKDIEWQLVGGSLKIGEDRTCLRSMNRIRGQCSRDGRPLKMTDDLSDFILHDLTPLTGLFSRSPSLSLYSSGLNSASPEGLCIFCFLCFWVFVCRVLPRHGSSQLKCFLLGKDFAGHSCEGIPQRPPVLPLWPCLPPLDHNFLLQVCTKVTFLLASPLTAPFRIVTHCLLTSTSNCLCSALYIERHIHVSLYIKHSTYHLITQYINYYVLWLVLLSLSPARMWSLWGWESMCVLFTPGDSPGPQHCLAGKE